MPASLDMPSYCFDVILARLNGESIPKCIEKYPNIPNDCYPLFVTWKKGYNKDLRGCIGTFSRDLSLHQGLHDYAQNSAFNDSRFQPVAIAEISALHCGVSILVKFEPAEHYRDWIVGIHGIRIDFQQYGRRLSAVYLPEVAAEQGWDHIDTIDHLMRKGGFEGRISESDRYSITIERFQSEKVNLSFDEYVLYKKQNGLPIPNITSHSHKNGLFKNHRRAH